MDKKREKHPGGRKGHHNNPLPGEIRPEQRERNADAHQEAERDMTDDAEFTAHSTNDDLDEGESARLGENNTGLI